MKNLFIFVTLLMPLSAGAVPLAKPVAKPMNEGGASVVYPASAGVLNVRDAAFGARGDGKTDDTQAIQKALTAGLGSHRVVYLPNGTYLVSDTLKWQNPAEAGNRVQGWGPFLQLQGQSRAKTIIRLKDGAPGFGDEKTPKAVVQTGLSGSHGSKQYSNGEGNEAFENHLRNFSVETGERGRRRHRLSSVQCRRDAARFRSGQRVLRHRSDAARQRAGLDQGCFN